MAVSDEKTRVMVTLSNKMVSMMDEYCQTVGISRSQYIASLVGNALYAQEKVVSSVLQGASDALMRAVSEGTVQE